MNNPTRRARLLARLIRTGQRCYRVVRAASWGQRLVLLLFAALAAGGLYLIPDALREDAPGLVALLVAFILVAALGTYAMGRSLIEEPPVDERPLPAAFWVLPGGVQMAIIAARQIELVVRRRGSAAEVAGAVGRWSGMLAALDREDRRLLHSRGIDVGTLDQALRDLAAHGSQGGAVVAARVFEDRLLGETARDPLRRPG